MTEKKPSCFGDIQKVFPLNTEGLRESPEECIKDCGFNKECILKAVEEDKELGRQNEILDAAYESGNIGFFARWAKKKTLYEKKRNLKNKQQDFER
ncbi:MAG: hypothetical protein CSA18_00430 [Deltaproteobacteria bacterium]|nr:MAG: hypothetical protein CSA18_00430 [Deltaproteobacteria bacterium]